MQGCINSKGIYLQAEFGILEKFINLIIFLIVTPVFTIGNLLVISQWIVYIGNIEVDSIGFSELCKNLFLSMVMVAIYLIYIYGNLTSFLLLTRLFIFGGLSIIYVFALVEHDKTFGNNRWVSYENCIYWMKTLFKTT